MKRVFGLTIMLLFASTIVATPKQQLTEFTDQEDAIIKQMQHERPYDIARHLGNHHTSQGVERRCVALNLHCGANAKKPQGEPQWKQRRK